MPSPRQGRDALPACRALLRFSAAEHLLGAAEGGWGQSLPRTKRIQAPKPALACCSARINLCGIRMQPHWLYWGELGAAQQAVSPPRSASLRRLPGAPRRQRGGRVRRPPCPPWPLGRADVESCGSPGPPAPRQPTLGSLPTKSRPLSISHSTPPPCPGCLSQPSPEGLRWPGRAFLHLCSSSPSRKNAR